MSSGSTIPAAVRRAVYERDGHRCVYCGASPEHPHVAIATSLSKLTLDHLLPESWGGSYATWNLATACLWCNISRRRQMPASVLTVLARNLAAVAA